MSAEHEIPNSHAELYRGLFYVDCDWFVSFLLLHMMAVFQPWEDITPPPAQLGGGRTRV